MEKFFNKTGGGYRKGGSTGGYKGGRSSGGGYKGVKSYGGSSDERPDMHPAICSECGASCEVPFKPNGKKPIFCRNCFQKQEGDAPAPRYGARSFDRAGASDKPAYRSTPRTGTEGIEKQLKALNEKMDLILAALMAPEEDEDEDEDEDDDNEEEEGKKTDTK